MGAISRNWRPLAAQDGMMYVSGGVCSSRGHELAATVARPARFSLPLVSPPEVWRLGCMCSFIHKALFPNKKRFSPSRLRKVYNGLPIGHIRQCHDF